MGWWSIGKIRGRYQPEDFTETQNMKLKDLQAFGAVNRVMFAGWDPREVTISFVVDSIHPVEDEVPLGGDPVPARDQQGKDYTRHSPCPLNEPEEVWRYIQQIQRPYPRPAVMSPILVLIPGWGERDDEVKYAYITNASIKRTHITDKRSTYFRNRGTSRAVRATITLTLKEAVFFRSQKKAKESGQTIPTDTVEES